MLLNIEDFSQSFIDTVSVDKITPLGLTYDVVYRKQMLDHLSKNWYIDDDGYLITKNLRKDENLENESDFDYRFNKEGFRSDHFEKLKDENLNIICSGCSYTFGEALPEEYIWPTLLKNKMKNEKIKLYNLGVRGGSVHIIVKNIFEFIRIYGAPDKIFVLFPGADRNITYYNDEYVNNGIFGPPSPNSPPYSLEYMKNYSFETEILLAIDMIKMLEDYCKSLNIDLQWSTWSRELSIYKKIKFENFVENDIAWLENINNHENTEGLPYWDSARDTTHPGTRVQTEVANLFYNNM